MRESSTVEGSAVIGPCRSQPLDDGARDTRDERYRARGACRGVFTGTGDRGLSTCGFLLPTADVEVTSKGGRRTCSGGLASCKWSGCPVCRIPIAMARAALVAGAAAIWIGEGNSCLGVTLTMPHQHDEPLDGLATQVADRWRSLLESSPYRRIRERLGIGYYMRSVEVTVSRATGWHPHIHAILFTAGHPSDEDLTALEAVLDRHFQRSALKRRGKTANPPAPPGIAVQVERILNSEAAARYLNKTSVGDHDELHGEPTLPTHQIAFAIARLQSKPKCDRDDDTEEQLEWLADRLREYRSVYKHRRLWGTSQGFRSRFPIMGTTETTPEQAAAQAVALGTSDPTWSGELLEHINDLAGYTVEPARIHADPVPGGATHTELEPPAAPSTIIVDATATVLVSPKVAWAYRAEVIRTSEQPWESALCRLIEDHGPLYAAWRLQRLIGPAGRIWVDIRGTRIRVGEATDRWSSPDPHHWAEVSTSRTASRPGPGARGVHWT